MPRPSPQTDRVVTVLNLLAAESDRGRTLTEIAEYLGLTSASCIPMLAALTHAGFLVRNPRDRRYRLGPSLVRTGDIAARRFPGLEFARVEMNELTRTFGLECLAFTPEDGHARLVAYTWDPRRPPPPLSVGELLPIRPPVGSVFVAWSDAAAVREWLERSPPALEAAHAYERLLAQIRTRGYVVEFQPPASFRRDMAELDHDLTIREAIDRLLEVRVSETDVILTDLDPDTRYRVGSISTPVFDREGRVCLALDVADFPGPTKGAEIEHVATLTRRAADRVTAALGGRLPRAALAPTSRRRTSSRQAAKKGAGQPAVRPK